MGSWIKHVGLAASRIVASVAGDMQLETVRTVVVVRRSTSGIQYLEIEPTPLVEMIDQRLAKGYRQAGQMDIEIGDYMVYVSRTYPVTAIAGDGITYLIDADVSVSPMGGMPAFLVPERLLEGTENFWHLILREQV